MNTRTRLSVTAVAACVMVAALTGCAASAPTPSPSATSATTGDETPAPSPSATATDAVTPSSPSQGPATSALAQHVYDECSKGAADAGVTLTFTDDPSGYTGSDGTYQLVYPFTFDDGHNDPYAMYNCTLTDDTVGSSYISSGMTDTH